MEDILAIFDVALLISTVRLVSPILLAALGGMFTERAGIFNIALEGLMLIGSFFAIAGVVWTGNPYLGVLTAVAAAMVISFFLGVVVIDLKGNAIVAGLAVNIFALGFTTYLMRPVFGVSGGSFYDPNLKGLPNIDIPFVADLPVIGPLVSGYSILVYVAVLLVPLSYVLLFHHPLGLRMRAVGEDPVAAGSIGINVRRTKYLAVLLSGALCGLAGAQLSISLVTQFVQGMTAGRGFIALVAVMFGRAHPVGRAARQPALRIRLRADAAAAGHRHPAPVRRDAAVRRDDRGPHPGPAACQPAAADSRARRHPRDRRAAGGRTPGRDRLIGPRVGRQRGFGTHDAK